MQNTPNIDNTEINNLVYFVFTISLEIILK